MRLFTRYFLCFLIVTLAAVGPAWGRITFATVEEDSRSLFPIDTPFGFGKNGQIKISVSNFSSHDEKGRGEPDPDIKRMGFFITMAEAQTLLEYDLSKDICPLDEEAQTTVTLFTMDQVNARRQAFEYKTSLKELISEYTSNEFQIFFANCAPNSMYSFNLQTELYNVKANGKLDYLSVGENELPLVYMVMFIVFVVLGAVWVMLVIRASQNVHRIHHLMTALVVFKALTLLSQAGMYHLIRARGHAEGWSYFFYLFTFIRGTLFFVVVVLIGTGWSYLKEFLADREKKILMVVIPLQVVAEVAIIVLKEGTPAQDTWFTWMNILHLVDIVCCCAILFPIVWSIKHLREASQTDGKAARSLHKLTLFRQFYVLVVTYIYFTRIVVYLLKSTVPFKYVWVSDAARETATVVFYLLTGFYFQPHAQNPYFPANADDEIDLQELRETA